MNNTMLTDHPIYHCACWHFNNRKMLVLPKEITTIAAKNVLLFNDHKSHVPQMSPYMSRAESLFVCHNVACLHDIYIHTHICRSQRKKINCQCVRRQIACDPTVATYENYDPQWQWHYLGSSAALHCCNTAVALNYTTCAFVGLPAVCREVFNRLTA